MDRTNPKRICLKHVSSSIKNSNPFPVLNAFDTIISSFLLLPDPPSTTIDCSFDRVLGQVLLSASESSSDDSVQDRLIRRVSDLGSALVKSCERFTRNRTTLYNSNSWALPHELTIIVFSMLDTKSLILAAASCTMFRKYAVDPLCYAHINLTMGSSKKKNLTMSGRGGVNYKTVFSMIKRAGKEIRSVKLGSPVPKAVDSGRRSNDLASMLRDSGLNGDLLRTIHLTNLLTTGFEFLSEMLLVSPNLTDLKIVNFDRTHLLGNVLQTLTTYRHVAIEHLFLESRINFGASGVSSSTLEAFGTSCPNLISLTLIGFQITEKVVPTLTTGFPKLEHLNLSRSHGITGQFLSYGDSQLKTLVLRDCPSLANMEIKKFLELMIDEEGFRFIKYIDISYESLFSSSGGHMGLSVLISSGGHKGLRVSTSFPRNLVKKLKEERSDINFLANFR